MRHVLLVTGVVLVYGVFLVSSEYRRRVTPPPPPPPADTATSATAFKSGAKLRTETAAAGRSSVRAAGRIEGRTEAIHIGSQIAERIDGLPVRRGQWVTAGTVLIELDDRRWRAQRDLAIAELAKQQAKLQRLINGARPSEIETAKHESEAAQARLSGARQAYQRAVKLRRSDAISRQSLDNLEAEWKTAESLASAANSRLETITLPPRDEERQAEEAAVAAAQAKLEMAEVELARTKICAPVDAQVLAVNVEVGERVRPEDPEPAIVLSDSRQLRVMAEIDEFDALSVRPRQRCRITCDAIDGTLATGQIVEIAPRMRAKRVFGQWADEKHDLHSRRVWISLDDGTFTSASNLPIGLPVEVEVVGEPPAAMHGTSKN